MKKKGACRYPERAPRQLRWWPSDSHRYLLLTPAAWEEATARFERERAEAVARQKRKMWG